MILGPAHMVEPTRSRPHWLAALYRRLLLVRGDPAAALDDPSLSDDEGNEG